jgi:murein DD-endopeptidase MepM/ murein hydrolase activator NlpD
MTTIFFVVLIGLFGVGGSNVFAQSSSDLQAEIEAKAKAKAELDEQLRQDQAKLDAISAEKNTLDKTVKELDLTGKKLNTEVKLTQSKIGVVESTIKNLNVNIFDRLQRIDNLKVAISQNIKELNASDDRPFVMLVLDKGSLTEALNVSLVNQNLNKQMGEAIYGLMTETERLNKDKQDRELKKVDLEEYKGEVVVQQKEVESNKKEKTVLLNQTKSQEVAFKKIVEEKKKLQAQFEADLASLEAKLKFDDSKATYPSPKHGTLSWPLEHVLITQGFGLTESSYRLYSYRTGPFRGRHAGVDFRANSDKVLSMADGVVLGAGNTDTVCPKASTGIWVLIKHDNGLASTYFHLSQTLVKTGQRVKAGDLVAYSGNTGYSTAPHLHVGVMPAEAVSITTWASAGCPGKNYTTPVVANSFYLNPLDYLPIASDNQFKAGLSSGE